MAENDTGQRMTSGSEIVLEEKKKLTIPKIVYIIKNNWRIKV